MTAFGSTIEECAAVVGTTKRTIHRWRKEDADFKQRMDTARITMQTKLKQTAYRMATGPEPDKTMLIFLLKTLCGLREGADPPADDTGPVLVGVKFVPAPKAGADG